MICYNQEDKLILKNHINSYLDIAPIKVGITSGCFDILHPLHVLFLEKCRFRCDFLIVFVDSDELVKTNKKRDVVFAQRERLYMVNSLDTVDSTILLNNYDPDIKEFCELINTDIFMFKNSDKIYDKQVETFGYPLIIINDVILPESSTEIREILCNTGSSL